MFPLVLLDLSIGCLQVPFYNGFICFHEKLLMFCDRFTFVWSSAFK